MRVELDDAAMIWRHLSSGVLAICGLLLTACSGVAIQSTPSYAASSSYTAVPGEVTHVRVSELGGGSCRHAPVTFGQPFVRGDLPAGQTLTAQLKGQQLPTQVDVKARNADGSARHAIVTIDVPCDQVGGATPIALVQQPAGGGSASGSDVSLADVTKTSFDARVELDIDGKAWHLNARSLLDQVSRAGGCQNAEVTYCRRWMTGPLAADWVVGAPLVNADGQSHPHLAAYFSIRAYGPAPVTRVRADVVVENAWSYQPNPTNVKYKPAISVGGKTVYAPKAFTHYRQARWHHVVWWGESDQAPLYAALDPAYLQSTAAVPRYQDIRIAAKLKRKARQACAPMQSCDVSQHMQNTGAQPQIGPLPRWSAAFVIDPDYRLFNWMKANADALGAYKIHYRSRDTGNALSLRAHPCATTLWPARQARCSVPPHKDDRFPKCGGDCDAPMSADEAHHPAPSYVAYLATGDWYYQTEMTFWANWAIFWQNPDYRDYQKGLVHRTQLRGQAWGLRTLGDAAYLLPDDAPKKDYFNAVVANNLEFYNEHYSHNPKANKLGAISNYHAVIYPHGGHQRTGIATWQQSFFTWAAGNLADQGFAGADALRDWVSQFAVGTMTAPGFCWELASAYNLRIRDTQKAPFYDTFAQVYDESFPKLADKGCEPKTLNTALKKMKGKKRYDYPPRTMVGYPKSGTGFPANFQIGVAAAANSNVPNAARAWSLFAHRNTPSNYSYAPQFAVVPSR